PASGTPSDPDSITGTLASGYTLTWDKNWNLNPGQSQTVSFKAKATPSVDTGAPNRNVAAATGESLGALLTADDDAFVDIIAELGITKYGPNEAMVGSTITYTGTLTNNRGGTAYDVVLVDKLPDGLSFVSSSHTADYDPVTNTVTWHLGNLAPGASIPGWLTVKIDPSLADGTVLSNEFEVRWEDRSGNLYGPSTVSWDTTVHTYPLLTVIKGGPTESNPGKTFTYTLVVKNIGGTAATDVVLTDTLPGFGSLTYVSANPEPSSHNGVITWNLGTISPGGSRTVTLTVQVDSGLPNKATLTDSASVTWKYDGVEYGPSSTTFDTTIYTDPNLVITKYGPAEAVVGSTITYTGTLTNTGGSTAYDVVLVDKLPNGLSFVSSSHTADYDPVTNTVTWHLGNLAPGASIPGWLTVKIDSISGDKTIITNVFSVTWKDSSGTTHGPSTASWDTTVYTLPELIIEKNGPSEANPGDAVSYTIKVTNIGGTAASNVMIVDALPIGFLYQSSNPTGTYDAVNGLVIWNIGTVEAYSTIEVSVTFKVDYGVENNMILVNTASVTWQDTLGRDYGPKGAAKEVTIYTLPQLKIDKIGPSVTYPGATYSYTITVENVGGATASTVVLTDSLPTGLTYIDADPDPSSHNGVITWNLETISPGASKSVTLTVQVDGNVPDGTSLNNIASVSWKHDGDDLGPSETSWRTQSYTSPQLSVSKTGPTAATQGDQVSYEIKVCNLGGAAAVEVILYDFIPVGFAYVSSNPQGILSNGYVAWSLGTISAGTCATVTITMSVDYDLPTPITLLNTAIVNWQDAEQNQYGPLGDSIEIKISKRVTPSPPTAPRQPKYVGGLVLPVNKVWILLPYITSIGAVAIPVILVKRLKPCNKPKSASPVKIKNSK
ncbi:MAG: DUF11 domain-containing protein, partial [Candidatus Bathyarchaeia archaeon]